MLELLEHTPFPGVHLNYRKEDAQTRIGAAVALFGDMAVSPVIDKSYVDYFDMAKGIYGSTFAEGVVLKQRSSKLIGSLVSSAKNPAWIKCKWRAGSNGLAPQE